MAKKQYFKVDVRIANLPETVLTKAQKMYLSKLDFRCNHKRICWWPNKKLAEDEGRCVRTIQYWNQKLAGLGLIEIQRSEGGGVNVIHVPEFDDDVLWNLGSRWNQNAGIDETDCMGGCNGLHGGDATDCTPILKGKGKTKMKTDGKKTFDEVNEDEQVKDSAKRAEGYVKKRKPHTVVSPEAETPLMERMWSPEPTGGMPDEAQLSKWSARAWTDEFISRMRKRGYQVAYPPPKYKASVNHIAAVKDHLRNTGLSYRKIYRFLLMWFPDSYEKICETEFKQDPDDFMFSVAWMEPRLSRLVKLFKEGDGAPKRTSKKRKAL